jgi:hypothetical protein
MCGEARGEALRILTALEIATRPARNVRALTPGVQPCDERSVAAGAAD